MVYPYNKILFTDKKECITYTQHDMDELKNIMLSKRIQSQQTIILFHIITEYYCICMKCLEKSNLWRKKVDLSQVLPGVKDVSPQHD